MSLLLLLKDFLCPQNCSKIYLITGMVIRKKAYYLSQELNIFISDKYMFLFSRTLSSKNIILIKF